MAAPVSRGVLLHRVAVGGVTLLGAGGAGATGAVAARSAAQDERALAVALRLARLQSALYEQARRDPSLGPELLAFARTAAAHQRGHIAALTAALAGGGDPPPVGFAEEIRSAAAFAETAAWLEDLSVLLLNGQAAALAPDTLTLTARIASADARHAAWVRGIVVADPSHHVLDAGWSVDAVEEALRRRELQPGRRP